jgi:predicted lipid-binding transport protein (Tim44 family)
MKKLVIALFAGLVGFGLIAQDAEAKRFGGGRSSGLQRDSVMRRDAAPTPPAAPARSAQQPGGGSRWLGPLAGLAAGLGLAALFSHLGLSEEFGSLLLMVAIAFAAFWLLRRVFGRAQPGARAMQYAGGDPSAHAPGAATRSYPAGSSAVPSDSRGLPAGFDAAAFARQAKLNFIRLQAAHDSGNLEDIREFTTPEMFAEIRLQMQERGDATQRTDVVRLEAEVLDATEEAGRYVASVRFSGEIREDAQSGPQPFDEVWHLVKPADGSAGWVIAGIQQTT